jgi:hypothetical protein
MGDKPRSTQYWFKRNDSIGNGVPLPYFIEDNQDDWIEITNRKEIRNIFITAVAKELNSKFASYRIFVHKTDPYFSKGVYGVFANQLKDSVGEDFFNNVLFKNGFRFDDKLNWHILKPLFANLGYTIVENILEGCITIENKVKNTQDGGSSTKNKK